MHRLLLFYIVDADVYVAWTDWPLGDVKVLEDVPHHLYETMRDACPTMPKTTPVEHPLKMLHNQYDPNTWTLPKTIILKYTSFFLLPPFLACHYVCHRAFTTMQLHHRKPDMCADRIFQRRHLLRMQTDWINHRQQCPSTSMLQDLPIVRRLSATLSLLTNVDRRDILRRGLGLLHKAKMSGDTSVWQRENLFYDAEDEHMLLMLPPRCWKTRVGVSESLIMMYTLDVMRAHVHRLLKKRHLHERI
jgi:hypothetical protein